MKYFICIILSLTLLLALLPACGQLHTVATPPTPMAPPVVKLTFFGFKVGAEIGALEELIAQFNAENPDIQVTYEGVWNGGYPDLLGTRLASGQGDDIFLANPNYLGRLQNCGYLENLSTMPVVTDYSDLVRELATIDGKIPGLPLELAAFGIFINNEVLRAHHIAPPQNSTDLVAACARLKAAGVTPIVAGSKDGTGIGVFCSTIGMEHLYASPDKAAKIEAVTRNQQSLAATMQEGFQFVSQLKEQGYIDAEKSLTMTLAQEDITAFAQGQAAFMPGGGWSLSAVQEAMPGVDVVLAGIPAEQGPLVLINAGVRICINSAGKHKAEARRFVEFMTHPEHLNRYVSSQNAFTPLKNGSSTDNAAMSAIAAQIEAGQMIPWTDPAFQRLDPWMLSKEYSAKILAGYTVAAAMQEMDRAVAQVVAPIQ